MGVKCTVCSLLSCQTDFTDQVFLAKSKSNQVWSCQKLSNCVVMIDVDFSQNKLVISHHLLPGTGFLPCCCLWSIELDWTLDRVYCALWTQLHSTQIWTNYRNCPFYLKLHKLYNNYKNFTHCTELNNNIEPNTLHQSV